MSSIAGLQSIMILLKSRCQNFDLLPLQPADPNEHHFGPDSEFSVIQKLIGKARIKFFTLNGSSAIVTFYITMEDNPGLLGRNFWDDSSLQPISMPWKNVVSVNINGQRENIPSFADPSIGGLRRIKLLMPPVSTHSLTSKISAKKSSLEILKQVHNKTHAPFRDIQMLLERTGNWSPVTASELKRLREDCEICRVQSNPKPNTKYGLKISPDFNYEAVLDITYLDIGLLSISPKHLSEVYSGDQMAILHIMCNRTWYSEVEVITSRRLSSLIECVERLWTSNHGSPHAMYVDSEFNKGVFCAFLKENSIVARVVPPGRHNKLRVERKNKTLKLFIRKLRTAFPGRSLQWSAKRANFLANIFYGSKSVSAFELARGYSPRITDGTNLSLVEPEVIQAYLDDRATKTLDKILVHRKHQNRIPDSIKPGDRILAYKAKSFNKRGSWSEYRVHSVTLDRSSLTVKPFNHEIRFAPEDILPLPEKQTDVSSVENEAGVHEEDLVPHSMTDDSHLADERHEGVDETTFEGSENVETTTEQAQDHDADQNLENCSMDDSVPNSLGTQNVDRQDHTMTVESPSSGCSQSITDEILTQPRRSHRVTKGVPPERYGFLSAVSSLTDQLCIGQNLQEQEYNTWLARIHQRFGTHDHTRNQLAWVPHWVLNKALKVELENYNPVVELVDAKYVPSHANVIDSHTLYRVKVKEGGVLQLKARIVPHGNKDIYKELVRSDSEVAEHSSYRTVMAFAAIFSLKLFKIDVTAAFLQTGPARRTVYVRPPYDAFLKGKLWKLKTTVYGLTEANRTFQILSDDVLTNPNKMAMECIQCCKQLFAKFDSSGNLTLLVAKQVDDLLCAGTSAAKDWFIQTFKNYFKVGTVVSAPESIRFDGGTISVQENGDVCFSMQSYLQSLTPINLTRERRKQQFEQATAAEVKAYREKAGQLCWLGMGAYPMGYFYGSYLQQRVGDLRVRHLCLANGVIAEAKKFDATVVYRSGKGQGSFIPRVLIFTDAGGSNKDSLYYQEGELVGLTFGDKPQSNFYLLDWKSFKQRRVAQSAAAAEGIAAHTGVYRGIALREMLETLTKKILPLDLVVDSMSLYRGMVTSHDPHDLSMRKDIAALRELYGTEVIHSMRWIKGTRNPADALTKRGAKGTAEVLKSMYTDGRLGLTLSPNYSQNCKQSDEMPEREDS